MRIQQMFERDINRYINGVISVGEDNTVKQELEEYVVTRELQRHFDNFFEAYERGIDNPARNVGVWIQGYFGSGKSHFLKMLSYLLENREVAGKPAVDYFRNKFDDAMTYAKIERAAKQVHAETILFNIDEKGGGYKEGDTAETAVLRSIARVFYEHLGFYGRDYKLARFEKMIDDLGGTAKFRAEYEAITGVPWVDIRESYDMFGEEVAEAAHRAIGVSANSVMDWADSTENVTVDFGELVSDINEYAKKRESECGKKFRLLFMVDEMGQYLNGDVSRMLNLQTLVEQFCDKCGGRVWMVVTSQEAIDEMMTVVSMDFSKIQGRFATRLSLSSSSVDEVIKKRVLDKTTPAKTALEGEYQVKSAILKNLFSFENSRGDLGGYATEDDFVESFPFVGYQFTLMPSVLKEIRKHGYQGKSLSTGERSMLSSYQEAAQAVEQGDEQNLVPFWRFFDTLEKELDHGIKQVFERCRNAASSGYGIHPEDVDVLKTLYLINYINDVRPTIGNIAILMVDNIDVDKVSLREQIKNSLDRLVRENYVARNGEQYSFLTDEEQDVAREIRDVQIDPAQVIDEIKKIIFEKIYPDRKYKKGANDFPFDRYVDDTIYGKPSDGMKLNIITVANTELPNASDGMLDLKSTNQALVVLDTANDYYDVLYNAARIDKYSKTQNVQQLPESKRRIVEAKHREASANRKEAESLLAEAISKARISVCGRRLETGAVNAKQKIEAALDELVGSTFNKSTLIDAPINSDGQLIDILIGKAQGNLEGISGANEAAAQEMDQYLETRTRLHQATTMGELQRHFQAKPYGWREIDIAAVAARLIAEQKVSVTYGGERVMPSDKKMKDYLRTPKEADKTVIKKRVKMPEAVVKRAKNLLRDLDGETMIPADEDGLVKAVNDCLDKRIDHYNELIDNFYRGGSKYPGREDVDKAIHLAKETLEQVSEGEAFLREFSRNEDDFLDNMDDLAAVEEFFNTNQKNIFDESRKLADNLSEEKAYVEGSPDVQGALANVIEILDMAKPYRRIKELPALNKAVKDVYGKLVNDKRNDVLTDLEHAIDDIKQYAEDNGSSTIASISAIANAASQEAVQHRDQIHAAETCTQLDAIVSQIRGWKEGKLGRIDSAVAEEARKTAAPAPVAQPRVSRLDSHQAQDSKPTPAPAHIPAPAPKVKVISRNQVLPSKLLRSKEDIDAYVEQFRERLIAELEYNDSIRLGD